VLSYAVKPVAWACDCDWSGCGDCVASGHPVSLWTVDEGDVTNYVDLFNDGHRLRSIAFFFVVPPISLSVLSRLVVSRGISPC
jgi:hypothetical protein